MCVGVWSMDFSTKWSNLPTGPSLKNLTQGGFGVLKETQHEAVQDLTRAQIESFDQAVTSGLIRVVQVRSALTYYYTEMLLYVENEPKLSPLNQNKVHVVKIFVK